MDNLNKHSKTLVYYLRGMFIFTLFAVQLSFISGCSIHKKTTPQPGKIEYKKIGIASYYSDKFKSRKTASGETFDNNLMTASHKTLPFGTTVLVTNLNNGKSVKVKINDRGPFIRRRIIDLTRAAFAKIENLDKGFTKVEIMIVD